MEKLFYMFPKRYIKKDDSTQFAMSLNSRVLWLLNQKDLQLVPSDSFLVDLTWFKGYTYDTHTNHEINTKINQLVSTVIHHLSHDRIVYMIINEDTPLHELTKAVKHSNTTIYVEDKVMHLIKSRSVELYSHLKKV